MPTHQLQFMLEDNAKEDLLDWTFEIEDQHLRFKFKIEVAVHIRIQIQRLLTHQG